MDTRIKLRVQGLTNSQIQSGAYALILAEEEGVRRIPIIVGTSEAQSIAIALERITPPRPLTHDLFATFAQAFGIRLREVMHIRVAGSALAQGQPPQDIVIRNEINRMLVTRFGGSYTISEEAGVGLINLTIPIREVIRV